MDLTNYPNLLNDIRQRIGISRQQAALSANAELIYMYWDIGRIIQQRQKDEGWGAQVIPQLARDLKEDMHDSKGFSERNLKDMVRFYKEYPKVKQPAALKTLPSAEAGKAEGADLDGRLAKLVLQIPWGHNIMLMQKLKEHQIRLWYMEQCIDRGWSRSLLSNVIKSNAHQHKTEFLANFSQTGTKKTQVISHGLKDPHVYEFLQLDEPHDHDELNPESLKDLEMVCLDSQKGFSLVGRDYMLDDFAGRLDLLFYHFKLRRFIAASLCPAAAKEKAAKGLADHCRLVDEKMKHVNDQSTMGILLSQKDNTILAEYLIRGLLPGMELSEFELYPELPAEMSDFLPAPEDIARKING